MDYLVTGAVALVLHGVPRLTPDIDLAIDPAAGNLERAERLLAAWGYGEFAPPEQGTGTAAVRRFRHPLAALAEIDILRLDAEEYARRRGEAAAVSLVDLEIPLVGAAALRALAERAGTAAGREDAAGLATLEALRGGGGGGGDATRREQIRKFSGWSVAARLDWLLAAARLARGLAPEAKPMTRGLVRRRGWYGRR